MALGPFRSEQVYDPQFEELVEHICQRPSMYVHPATFGGVCAYLEGFNAARDGGPLLGLREWLILRINGWNNMSWSRLAGQLLTGDHVVAACSNDEDLIGGLGRLLKEYLEYRTTVGLCKLFFDYGHWLRNQDWYSGPLRAELADDA